MAIPAIERISPIQSLGLLALIFKLTPLLTVPETPVPKETAAQPIKMSQQKTGPSDTFRK
jgi:hypothetical protein